MTNEKPIIHIEFEEFGSVKFSMNMSNIIPMQLLALAQYFDWKGKTALAQQEYMEMQKKEANKIAIPEHPEIMLGKK